MHKNTKLKSRYNYVFWLICQLKYKTRQIYLLYTVHIYSSEVEPLHNSALCKTPLIHNTSRVRENQKNNSELLSIQLFTSIQSRHAPPYNGQKL